MTRRNAFLYSKFDAGVGNGRPTRPPMPPPPLVVLLPFCVRLADDLRDSTILDSCSLLLMERKFRSFSLVSVNDSLETCSVLAGEDANLSGRASCWPADGSRWYTDVVGSSGKWSRDQECCRERRIDYLWWSFSSGGMDRWDSISSEGSVAVPEWCAPLVEWCHVPLNWWCRVSHLRRSVARGNPEGQLSIDEEEILNAYNWISSTFQG